MERSDNVDGFLRQQGLDYMRRQHQLMTGQGLEGGDRDFEDAFSKLGIKDESFLGSSSPRLNVTSGVGRQQHLQLGAAGGQNFGPNWVDGFSGLGLRNDTNVSQNSDYMLYKNGYYNPVGYGAGTGPANFGNYQAALYQAELYNAQVAEFWRRNGGAVRREGVTISPYLSWHKGFDVAVAHQRRGQGNRGVVGNIIVAGLRPEMGNRRLEQGVNEVNLMDLRGEILRLAVDQYGCRLLQMKFGTIKEEEIEMILKEVIDKVSNLMMDQFGNYLVQMLVEVCNEEQKTEIIRSITKKPYLLITVCLNVHGTRVMQKVLENLRDEQHISMVISAISPGVVTLIKNVNGHHVIQHCLKHFSAEHNMIIINEIARNCYDIATDKSGCCVLQLCVDLVKGEIKEHLISVIIANALVLAEDRYGNYVVQHILLMKVPRILLNLVNELQGNFFSLSCNKYGSNVVEKCLTETGEEFSKLIILELLKHPGISKLLQDPFGNYVYQSALSVSKGMLHNALVSLVDRHSSSLCSNLYGKKVLAWFDNRKRLYNSFENIRA